MKSFVVTVALFLAPLHLCASMLGWFTSQARDWRFIQATGGIRIGVPIERDGQRVLPVEYDVTGLRGVTCKPTSLNSGLAVRKIETRRAGTQIIIRVYTQTVEKSSPLGPIYYADIGDIPGGTYEVFYESADTQGKSLGRIELK
jgi:hypothetical protein